MTGSVSQDAKATDVDALIDPITFSVLLNRFSAIAREMTLSLEYTAWTSILALVRDFSCAIFDGQARQVCMADAIPIHTNSLHVVLKEMTRVFENDIHDGDVIVCNDPYSGNTHVGDVVTACPVFHEGRQMFWSVTKGHQLDIGSFIPTSTPATARDIYQEGLTIPPLKFYEKGKARHDVIRLYLANVRYSDQLYGDLMAQLGSIWNGRRRLQEMIAEYGADNIARYVEAIHDYADRRMREEIRAMPKGTFVGESWMDSDGQGNADIHIRAAVTIGEDHITVDYTGSAPQTPGAANASIGVMQAASGVPILCCIDPTIPHNDGCLRHITGIAPLGSVCNAKHPGSTAIATTVPGDPMQDAVWKALAKAMPDRAVAGFGRVQSVPVLSGVDRRTNLAKDWAVMLFNGASGGGAAPRADGWPLMMTLSASGGLKSMGAEMTELLYPMHVERMEIEPDSMGQGKHRGGPGINMVLRGLTGAMECHLFGDGAANPPHGVLGGTPGIGGGNYREDRKTGGPRTYCSAKGHLTIGPEETWVSISTGGGGYGDPLERPADVVCRDVRDGVISESTARDIYGLVWNPTTFAVDEAATDAMRARISGARGPLPLLTPENPSASPWLKQHMRPGDVFLLDPQ